MLCFPHPTEEWTGLFTVSSNSFIGNYEEYIYSQLLLFHPHLNEEDDLFRNDVKKRLELYNKKDQNQSQTNIEKIKHHLFPHWNTVDEGRKKAEELKRIIEMTEENNDQIQDEENLFRFPDDNLQKKASDLTSVTKGKKHECLVYIKNDIPPLPILYEKVQSLHPEQKQIFDDVFEYCIKIKKNRKEKVPKLIKPPRLIIHGGAGSGKSFLIETITSWVEHVLRTPGDSTDSPYVIKCAFSGTTVKILSNGKIRNFH